MILTRAIRLSKRHLQYATKRLQHNGVNSLAQKMTDKDRDNIVWIDMEMTGLDVQTCHILEVACLVTDKNLTVLSDDLNIVVNQPDDILHGMNEWCQLQHKRTGLIDASKNSKITELEAEQMLLSHLEKYVPKGLCPMAGNSVYMDRLFLQKYMPSVNDYLHYRIIDVTSIKELARRWYPQLQKLEKDYTHRALDDIKESIKELHFYKHFIFNN